jgi:hypothetical protein
MRPHEINDLNNFIMAWRIDDNDFCDVLLNYHASRTAKRGQTGIGVHLDVKDSFDVTLNDGEEAAIYFSRLQECVDAYTDKYPYSYKPCTDWKIIEGVNIQKYLPGGGYHAWHCERSGNNNIINTRHFVFMTYLNDVTDDGETEFLHQKIKIRPEKGLTVVWPSDWTFTHRGVMSKTQEKTIITGWISFVGETQRKNFYSRANVVRKTLEPA